MKKASILLGELLTTARLTRPRVAVFVLMVGGLAIARTEAQLVEVPFWYNPQQATAVFTLKGGGQDTLSLPFVDDFSYNSPQPDPQRWADRTVFVNATMAINPPTWGVATFDGLNANGRPYSNGGSGGTDTLTSCPLRLGGKNAASKLALSFFYQPKGYGDKPGATDSLIVEFRRSDGSWVSVFSHADTTASAQLPVFEFVALEVNQPSYWYDGFQFRFRTIGKLTGSRDHWHLDYVRLTEGQIASTVIEDVAFVQPSRSILSRYTALPWRHFEGFEQTELARQNQILLTNHFNAAQLVKPAYFKISERVSGNVLALYEYLDLASSPLNGNIPKGTHLIDSVLTSNEAIQLLNAFLPYYGADSLFLDLTMNISPANQQGSIASVVRNDTVSRRIAFSNYFAYDDGTAETAVAAGRIGDQFAVKFRTNVADTLRAIQLHLPRVEGLVNNQLVNLKVWVGALDGSPEWEREFVKAIYVDQYDAWTTYSLDSTPVALPAGTDFYIGWQQATVPSSLSKSFIIGYDRNSALGYGQLYENIGNGWQLLQNTGLPSGSVMMRPVVGGQKVFTTRISSPVRASADIDIFPNPVSDQLSVLLKTNEYDYTDFEYQLFDSRGVLAQFGILASQIIFENRANGIYWLKIHDKKGRIAPQSFKLFVIRS